VDDDDDDDSDDRYFIHYDVKGEMKLKNNCRVSEEIRTCP
jgi:hypothetical protein